MFRFQFWLSLLCALSGALALAESNAMAETQSSSEITSCMASGAPSCSVSCEAPSVAYCIQGLNPTTDIDGNQSSPGIPGYCSCN